MLGLCRRARAGKWRRRTHCDSKTVNVNGGPLVGYLTRAGWPEPDTGGMTRRRIAVLTALVLVVAAAAGVTAWLRFSPACTVQVGDQSVGLAQQEAQDAAVAAASVVRRAGTANDAGDAVRKATELTGTEADLVGDALSGRSRAAVTCRHGGADDAEPDTLDDAGLTNRAQRVRADLTARFGDLPLGGFAPGGVTTGHMPGSTHYEGRALDVFFRPVREANKTRGWALAQYLVAHAVRLEIDTVIFDGRIWTARRALQGWRDYDIDANGRSDAVLAVLEHRDHVHVDVAD